jgi:hypothetical protein
LKGTGALHDLEAEHRKEIERDKRREIRLAPGSQ